MMTRLVLYIVAVAYVLLNIAGTMVASLQPNNIVWSVNAGGEKHTDIYGIRYSRDTSSVGEASDYGKTMMIGRVSPQDQILYQTERYHTNDFSYTIPLREDGDYVLVLKFSEVWFNAPRQKVFDVLLNEEHKIVEALDIYSRVGRAVAHDEIIPFKVQKNHIVFKNRKSPIIGNKAAITFVKDEFDNPKLNAAYLLKGTASDVPTLPPLATPEPEDDEDESEQPPPVEQPKVADNIKRKHSSGPKIEDPYTVSDNSSYLLPVVAAIGAFIPLLYCLCKI